MTTALRTVVVGSGISGLTTAISLLEAGHRVRLVAAEREGVEPTADDRLEGSVATALLAADAGVGMLRVHDVAATVAALGAAGGRRDRDADRSALEADLEPMEAIRWP